MSKLRDLLGQVFGHLTVIAYMGGKPQYKRTKWLCRCDCADHTELIVDAQNLLSGNTTKCKYCRAKNIIGQRFNRLTVIERVIVNEHVMWKAKCDCGNEIIIRADSLTSGHTKSCGCLQKDFVKNLNANDLVGRVFGYLTVRKRSNRKDRNGMYYWYCDCKCGAKHHEVNGHHLLAGHVFSCGCCKSKGEAKIADLLSQADVIFKKQYKVKDFVMSTGGNPRFDFAILNQDKSVAYFIEYQGEQHFIARGNIFTPQKVALIQQRDKEKAEYCESHRIPLIQIIYTEYESFTIDDIYLPALIH